MIMPRGQQLLLPANPLFVLFTLLTALFANMVVNISLVGNAAWMPDFLALVLVFWCVHQPRLVGIGLAFFFGVATDVHQAALLGQHAMSYTALGFMAIMVHRRLLWFTVPSQAMQVLPLFVLAHALELTVRMMSGALFPGWMILLAPLLEAFGDHDVFARMRHLAQRVLARVVHRGRGGHRRGQEGLHLVGAKAVLLQPQREFEHVAIGRAGMRGDEVGNQVLLLARF